MEFLKKHWVWIVVAVLGIYLYLNYTKRKQAEDKAIALFNKLNSMSAQAKAGQAYSSEKTSLVKLVDNSTEKERQILADLLNGTIGAFTAAEQEKDKEKAKKGFGENIAKMQNDLIAKHGRENVVKFKVKMDKYGFDI
jgi:hypothetical protein